MTPLMKRMLMFLGGCIPMRIGISYLIDYLVITSKNSSILNIVKYILSLKLMIIGLGFLSIYWFGLRKTGIETQGEPIWWNSLRPIHGLLYGTAGVLLLLNYNELYGITSGQMIFWDAILGLVSFLIHHLFFNQSFWKRTSWQ